MRWLDGISVNMNLSKLWETVEDREACSMTVHGAAESDTTYPLNKNNLHNPLDFLNTFNLTYS